MMRSSLAIVFAVSLALAGCTTNGGPGPGNGGATARPVDPAAPPMPSPHVDAIELAANPPIAIESDSTRPGPEGVGLQLWFYSLSQNQALMLNRGIVEFLLYEGNVRDTEIVSGAAVPFKVWSYSADRLQQFSGKVLVGTQYGLALMWDDAPTTRIITVSVRMLRPNAPPLYAKRVVLTTGPG